MYFNKHHNYLSHFKSTENDYKKFPFIAFSTQLSTYMDVCSLAKYASHIIENLHSFEVNKQIPVWCPKTWKWVNTDGPNVKERWPATFHATHLTVSRCVHKKSRYCPLATYAPWLQTNRLVLVICHPNLMVIAFCCTWFINEGADIHYLPENILDMYSEMLNHDTPIKY